MRQLKGGSEKIFLTYLLSIFISRLYQFGLRQCQPSKYSRASLTENRLRKLPIWPKFKDRNTDPRPPTHEKDVD